MADASRRAPACCVLALGLIVGCGSGTISSNRDGGPTGDGGPDGPCAPLTCQALGKNCGAVANGCGGTLECGTCAAPQTCGGAGVSNVCGCVPTTCAAGGKNCGTMPDGCGGTLSCGDCTPPEECGGGSPGTPNVCGEGPCTTLTTCAAEGKDCGTISDGCGGILDCGTCTAPATCGSGGVANVCGCSATTCAAQGKNCGTMSDGCGGTLDCGTCAAPQTCGGAGVENVCGGGTGTVTHGLTIPDGHPLLWFDAARLARARAWIAANPFTPPSDEWHAGGYVDVALHGLLTDNATGSCTTAISWGLSRLGDVGDTGGVACDPCRWTGESLIVIYDWCYAYMTADQRSTYIAAMNDGLYAWSRKSWGGPEMYQNNYYWGYLRNELEWSITSYHENTAWAEAMFDWAFTNRLEDAFNPSTLPSGWSRGGIAYEGSEYGPVVADYPLIPFITASLLGRNLYRETDFWREFVYGVIHQTTPGPTTVPGVSGTGYTVFPFSDDEGWNDRFQAQTTYFTNFMAGISQHWQTTTVGRHARQWLNMVGVQPSRHVQAVDANVTPLAFDSIPLDFYASGPRYLYGRTAWGPTSTAFLLQLGDGAGSTIGHQHGDYGTFHIWRNGHFVAREAAGYSGDTGTYIAGYAGSGTVDPGGGIAHNTVLVDGANPGPQYSGPDAVVERLESQPGYAYAVVDLVPPATRMQEWRREFVFVRGLATLVVFDRLQTANANATKTFINHCETNPTTSANTSATCTVGAEAAVMTTLLPAQRTYRVVDEGSAARHGYRIEVDTTPGTAQSYILTVIQAKDASGTSLAPSVSDDGSSYTLTLDGTTRMTFNQGMTSSGGSITIGGSTTSFRSTVQTMIVTDDGPVWQ